MTELHERREYAREWCDFAINRTPADRVYRWVTERRDPGPIYSSCGDLAHWLLERLGCVELFCNRATLSHVPNHPGYRPRRNVNLLTAGFFGGANELAKPLRDGSVLTQSFWSHTEQRAQLGDLVVMWPDEEPGKAHVCVVDTIRDGCLYSWDFGQGPRDPAAWKRTTHIEGFYRRRPRSLAPIKSWLSLADVAFNGELDLPSGERFDALEGLNP